MKYILARGSVYQDVWNKLPFSINRFKDPTIKDAKPQNCKIAL